MAATTDKKSLTWWLYGGFRWKRFAVILAAGYLALFILGAFFSDPLILPGRHTYKDLPGLIKIPVGQNESLSARYLPAMADGYTLLYHHGNGEDLGDIQAMQDLYFCYGYGILAYDYRGYGTSSGQASLVNAPEDALAAYRYLVDTLHVPPEKIITLGRSVGGAMALQVATTKPVAGVILESAFVSAFRVATRVPLLPFDRFNNLEKVPQLACPVLVIHGTKDLTVPFWHGPRLFAAIGTPKQCLWVDGAGHNDVPQVAGKTYWQAIKEFAALVSHRQAAQTSVSVSAPPSAGGTGRSLAGGSE